MDITKTRKMQMVLKSEQILPDHQVDYHTLKVTLINTNKKKKIFLKNGQVSG